MLFNIYLFSDYAHTLSHDTLNITVPVAGVRLMEKFMYGVNLIRLCMFIAFAIIGSTAIGLFTYIVVTVLAE
ncbi:Uncharacterised protein [Cedecea neteri]|uniref:Uncharacterized protein n=1 Tax=Cedecea neteri TaxID=158822 RepID=A0A2X3J987_9ENTR|nr:Uncharacterised protein [Cedecea neteri]